MTLLHRLIEAQARHTPHDRAVAFEGRNLTYAELNRRADALAGRLRDLGVGADVLVGLLVERSLETLVGILGILKAGGAYLPLDTALPRARLDFVLRDAGASIVVTQSSLSHELPEHLESIVCLDEFDWTSAYPDLGDVTVTPAHLAYVIYTSGSTGRPNGVCIEHRQIVKYVL